MFDNSVIVLTPGRTGSVLLASYLAQKKYHSVPVHLESLDDLDRIQWLRDIPTVFHSHNRLSESELDYLKPVYSVRRNLVEAIVSHALSNAQGVWHVPRHDTRPDLAPITLTREHIATVLAEQQRWFAHYASRLSANSVVVVYEVMVDILPKHQAGYLPTYPDKSELIVNYQEISSLTQQMIPPETWDQHAEFCDYPARVGVPSLYPHLLN